MLESALSQYRNTTFQGQSYKGSNRHQMVLRGASMNFDGIQALRNIDLTVDKGEIIFVTGPSGAGKTTLLKVLSGQLIPSEGKVALPNSNKCFTAQVFQDLRLLNHETCERNIKIAYDPSLYKGGRSEFQREMDELCRIFEITDRLHLKIHQANGGLKQKVAIIRALLSRPNIFLADEPTSSLDLDNASKLYDVLSLYNKKRGMTIVWASHNRDLVNRFTGRIVHLNSGKLVYSGHACFI